ncbi:MAG TPA: S9 family peptidase, partial [Phenylobacterium sp.]
GFDYDLKTGTAHALLRDVVSGLNTFAEPQVRAVGGKPTLFVQGIHFDSSDARRSLYRIDVDGDFSSLAEEGAPGVEGFLLGADGSPVAETVADWRTKRWLLKVKVGGLWREVRSEPESTETPALLGLGRDGRSVLVGELREGDLVVREMSPAGDWSKPLPGGDPGGAIFDPASHRLLGFSSLAGDEQRYAFVDPADQQVWTLVQHAYPNQRVRLVSWTDDRKKIVVLADSPQDGPGYGLIDLTTRHADWIANRYDKLGPDDIAPVRSIQFKAADGTQLTGYLTTPRGADPKKLPLVVFPHGGPAARDEPGFDWWAQAMASRGYAVLQVNFRGSDGFGWAFLQSGFGQWGRKMQTDLSDGVRYLAGEGTIDPKRVCIVGASYGGYAALAGAALDPGVYRCAVSVAGPADMPIFVEWARDHSGLDAERYWERFMGGQKAGDASLAQISPARHVDKVTAPVLLIHGKDDTVVPLEQSRIMANALKRAGKPVDLVILDSTDHWLTRGDTRLAMLKATVDFL